MSYGCPVLTGKVDVLQYSRMAEGHEGYLLQLTVADNILQGFCQPGILKIIACFDDLFG